MERFEETRLAVSAEYLSESRELKVTLDDGSKHFWPADRLEIEAWTVAGFESLTTPSDEDLCDVQVWGGGSSIYWEKLKQVFEVDELLAGIYGSPAWMASLMSAA
ncbi:MAG: DUF2442 domain-containing protein [Cyanobacteria bacterium J06627_28]